MESDISGRNKEMWITILLARELTGGTPILWLQRGQITHTMTSVVVFGTCRKMQANNPRNNARTSYVIFNNIRKARKKSRNVLRIFFTSCVLYVRMGAKE